MKPFTLLRRHVRLGASLSLLGLLASACDNGGLTTGLKPQAHSVHVVGDPSPSGKAGQRMDMPFVVQVLDEADRPLPGVDIRWEHPEGSLLSVQDLRSDAKGQARAWYTVRQSLSADTVLAIAVPATGAIVAPATFVIYPEAGPAAAVQPTDSLSGEGQVARPGSDLVKPYRVRVTDEFGNPARGVVVTWKVVSGGGSLSAQESVTDEKGVTQVSHTLGSNPGEQRVVAEVADRAASFEFVARAADVRVAAVSGDQQTGILGTTLESPFEVKVTDRKDGRALPGVMVTWAADNGGVLSARESLTNEEGVAETTLTLGNYRGDVRVVATVDTATASFVTKAEADADADQLVIVDGDGQFIAVNDVTKRPMRVQVVSGKDVAAVGAIVRWRITSAAGGRLINAETTVGEDGTSENNVEMPGVVGAKVTVEASVDGIGSVSFTHTVAAKVASPARYLEKNGGDEQMGPVGNPLTLPLSVIVLNENRVPVSGVAVQWRVPDRTHGRIGSHEGNDTTYTDLNGVAQISRTLGSHLGEQYAYASVPDLDGVELRFTSRAGSQNASADLYRSDTNKLKVIRSTQMLDSLGVTVVDSVRSPIVGTTVGWAVEEGTGKVHNNFTTTAELGLTSSVFTAGHEASVTERVKAYLPSIGKAVFFDIEVTGEPVEMVPEQGISPQTLYTDSATIERGPVRFASAISIRVTDEYGNTVRGAPIDWVASENGQVSEFGREASSGVTTYTDYDGYTRAYMLATGFGPVSITAWFGEPYASDVSVSFSGVALER